MSIRHEPSGGAGCGSCENLSFDDTAIMRPKNPIPMGFS